MIDMLDMLEFVELCNNIIDGDFINLREQNYFLVLWYSLYLESYWNWMVDLSSEGCEFGPDNDIHHLRLFPLLLNSFFVAYSSGNATIMIRDCFLSLYSWTLQRASSHLVTHEINISISPMTLCPLSHGHL